MIMDKEKISVVIPVYNLENYIERTLNSVCSQTYKNLEIIVVDDGSTDNSLHVIREYAKTDERIICISQENGGVTSARLNGISNAIGEWIGFVDGDDEIDEDMFEFLINNANKYDADISHCGYKMVFDDGRTNYFYNTKQIIEQNTEKGLKDLLDGNPIEPGLWNKLYKREVVEKANLNTNMDLSLKINEDLLMNFLLFQQSRKSVFADECKYSYIVRRGSASRSYSKSKIFDPIRVKEIILSMSSEKIKKYAGKAYLSTCINIYSKLLSSDYSCKEDEKEVRPLILKNHTYAKLLSKRQKCSYLLIKFAPLVYKVIYRIYAKKLKHNKYK